MKKQSSMRNLLAAFGNKQDFAPLSPQTPSIVNPPEADGDDDLENSSDPLIGKTIDADQTIEDEVRNLLGLAPAANSAVSSVKPPSRERGTITSHSRSAGDLDETGEVADKNKSRRSDLRKSKSGDGTGSRYVRCKHAGGRQRSMRRLTTGSSLENKTEGPKKPEELPNDAPPEDRRRTLTKIRQSTRRIKVSNDSAEDKIGNTNDPEGTEVFHDEQKPVTLSDSRGRDSTKQSLKRSEQGNLSSNRRSFRDKQSSSRSKNDALSMSLHDQSSVEKRENKEPTANGRRMSLRDKRSSSRRISTGENQSLPRRTSLRDKRLSSRRASETSSRRLSSSRLSSSDKQPSSRRMSAAKAPSSRDVADLVADDSQPNSAGGTGQSMLDLENSSMDIYGQQSFQSKSDSSENLFEKHPDMESSSRKLPKEGDREKEASSLLKPSQRDSRPRTERQRVKSTNSSQRRSRNERKQKRSSRKLEKVHRGNSESSGHSNSVDNEALSSSDDNNSMADDVGDYVDSKDNEQKELMPPQRCGSSTHDKTTVSKLPESDEPRISKYLELKKRSSMRKVVRDPYWERKKVVAEIVVQESHQQAGDNGAQHSNRFSQEKNSHSTNNSIRGEDAAVSELPHHISDEKRRVPDRPGVARHSDQKDDSEKTRGNRGRLGGEEQPHSEFLTNSSADQVNTDIAVSSGPLLNQDGELMLTNQNGESMLAGAVVDQKTDGTENDVTSRSRVNGGKHEGIDDVVVAHEHLPEKADAIPVVQALPHVGSSLSDNSCKKEQPQASEDKGLMTESGHVSARTGVSEEDTWQVSERLKNFKLVSNIDGIKGDKRGRRLSDSVFWRSERALRVQPNHNNDLAATEKESDSNSYCRSGSQYARRRSEGAIFIQSSINDLLLSPISNNSVKEARCSFNRDEQSKGLKEDRWAAISPMRPINSTGDAAFENEFLLSPPVGGAETLGFPPNVPFDDRHLGSVSTINHDHMGQQPLNDGGCVVSPRDLQTTLELDTRARRRSTSAIREIINRAPFGEQERARTGDTITVASKASTTQYLRDDRWAPISPMQPIVQPESSSQSRKSPQAVNGALSGFALDSQDEVADSEEHFESIKEELREDRWAPISPMRPIVATMNLELVQDVMLDDKARRWAASASNELTIAETDITKTTEAMERKRIGDCRSESEVSFNDSLLDDFEHDTMNAACVDDEAARAIAQQVGLEHSNRENPDLRVRHGQSMEDNNEDECARMIARKTALEHLIGEHMEALKTLRKELEQVETQLDNMDMNKG